MWCTVSPANVAQFMLERQEAVENSHRRAQESCNESRPKQRHRRTCVEHRSQDPVDETTSIDHDGDWFRRRIKEALHIRRSNAINSDPLVFH